MMLRDVAKHLGHLPPHHVTDVAAVGLLNLWRDRYAPGTLYGLRRNLQRFLKGLEAAGAPAITLPKVRPGKPRRTIATADETRKLLATAEPHLRLVILLWLSRGLRFAEGCSIAPRHWNRERHEITFTKKGGELHTLPTSDDIEALFIIAPDLGPAVPYVSALQGAAVTKEPAIRRQFFALRKKIGMNPAVTPHDLRRTLAVTTYEHTHDIRAVQQILGHESLATTARYLAHVDQGKLRTLFAEMRMPTEVKQ
jgi:integrase